MAAGGPLRPLPRTSAAGPAQKSFLRESLDMHFDFLEFFNQKSADGLASDW